MTLFPLLMTLTLRRKLHMAQCMFCSLSSQAPPYLSRLFSYVSCHHNTRSSFTFQLNLPLIRSSFGQRAFSFSGASLHGAAYPQPFVQHPTSASAILQTYVNFFTLIHERQCNNIHTTKLTFLYYLFIYLLYMLLFLYWMPL